MKICNILTALLIAFCISSAQAASLFPPDNIGSDPSKSCPNGQVLKWTGDGVECADPTPGVTVMCPKGQMLVGIKNGEPVCNYPNGGGFSKLFAGTAGDGQKITSPIKYTRCFFPNPITGSCSCPAGFKEHAIIGFDNRDECKYYNSPGDCGYMEFICTP